MHLNLVTPVHPPGGRGAGAESSESVTVCKSIIVEWLNYRYYDVTWSRDR